MPVDRPTFSESWYRVGAVRPRLRTTVQVYRQHFRGVMWHVLQDPASNQFFRLNEPAYRFVAMLDGRRSVAEVWDICNDQLGDEAPTQGEAIQLLGQLYTSNLLAGEMPPDAEGLLKRFRQRRQREIRSRLMNIMFIHIPLFDPENFLRRWEKVLGSFFSWWGWIVWLAFVGTGLYFLAGKWGDLTNSAEGVLDPENLPLLYVGALLAKVFHEFGHAFACKHFGKREGGGEVHEMGIMLLVFTPLPYVDASSAWALRSKVRRIIIGAGGMLVEMVIAAIAAIIWAQTSTGTTIHALCYNVMFIASVSTILFNANPLLRYDGYYILSDLLEIPNLAPRSRQYIYYLVKKYVYGVRRPTNPAHTRGEKGWFCFYGVASTCYRVIICSGIILMIAQRFFFIGAMLAVGAIILWLVVPLGKFVHYLATSQELTRVRPRAILTTLAFLILVAGGVGAIQVPDRVRIEGVVEPVHVEIIHAKVNGFLADFADNETPVGPDTTPPVHLITCTNPLLDAQEKGLAAKLEQIETRLWAARMEEQHLVQSLVNQRSAVTDQLTRVRQLKDWLTLLPDAHGVWLTFDLETKRGAYLEAGDPIGMIVSADDLLIRATADQEVGPMLMSEVGTDETIRLVDIRVRGRPEDRLNGAIEDIYPAGYERLPSAALGYNAGGKMATATDDPQGLKATERFFEVRVRPDANSKVRLLSGQRVVIRLELSAKPLALQGWLALRRLVQRRFNIL